MSSSDQICSANVAIKKQAGKLALTSNALTWTPTAPGEQKLVINNKKIEALFASKEGSQKVMLKVKYGSDQSESQNFIFSAASSAISDREKFKQELSQIIARNRSQSSTPAPPAASTSDQQQHQQQQQSKASSSSTQQQNGGPPALSDTPMSRSSSSSSKQPRTGLVLDDWQIKADILKRNKDLNDLHRELVRTNQITEDEFWEGREHLVETEKQALQQKAGRSAQLVDPKPETSETGEIKIRITPQLIADIFDQYPIVQKIYNENVPDELDEATFWMRYFHSKLFNKHRSSARALGGGMKNDPLFDKYLDEEDDGLEPKQLRDDHVDALLNLASTQEDHFEPSSVKDFSMRAGANRSSLPLIRRFNDYSERLLDRAIGPQKRQKTNIDGGDAGSRHYYHEIELDDLMDQQNEDRILLNIQNWKGFQNRNSQDDETDKHESLLKEIYEKSRSEWETHALNLGHFEVDLNATEHAMDNILQSIANRQASTSKTEKDSIPDDVKRQMISCQATANEFLRHFWSAVLPPRPGDISAAAMADKHQKGAKATKMIGYLSKTNDRIKMVIQTAAKRKADTKKVNEALKPVQNAVNKAITYYNDRTK